MRKWRSCLGGIVRRGGFRAEAEELVNGATLVLLAASVALLGSLVV